MRRASWLMVLVMLAMMVAGPAEAKPRAKVYGVTLEMWWVQSVPTEPLMFDAAWKVRHGPADSIQARLIVNGEVIRDEVLDGAASHRGYKVLGLSAGTVVTFAVRAITGDKVRRWRTATVVVPVRW